MDILVVYNVLVVSKCFMCMIVYYICCILFIELELTYNNNAGLRCVQFGGCWLSSVVWDGYTSLLILSLVVGFLSPFQWGTIMNRFVMNIPVFL